MSRGAAGRLMLAGAVVCLLLVVFSVVVLAWGSAPAYRAFGFSFIVKRDWNPVLGSFGALPFLVGTLMTSCLALFLSAPFALSMALLAGFYLKGRALGVVLSLVSDVMAGIPSVVYGFWGLYVLVPAVRKVEALLGLVPYGVGIATASVVLAVMLIPYIFSLSYEAVSSVPRDVVEAAYALGATRWEVARKVVLPYARSGVFAGMILALGRALGETMAVTMVIGNSNALVFNPLLPANTMASVIANEFTEATKALHLSALIYVGLWLMAIVALVNLIGMKFAKRFEVAQ